MKNLNLKNLFALFVVSQLVGCGNSTVTGQIYIEDGQNIKKISDAVVKVVPVNLFSFKNQEINSNVEKVYDILSNEKIRQESIMMSEKVLTSVHEALVKNQELLKVSNSNGLTESKKILESIRSEGNSAMQRIELKIDSFKSGRIPEIYWINSGEGVSEEVLSDGEGKFLIKKGLDKDSAIIAKSGDGYWFLSPDKGSLSNINLNSKNIFGSKCAQCFLELGNNDLFSEISKIANNKTFHSESVDAEKSVNEKLKNLKIRVDAQLVESKKLVKTAGDILIKQTYAKILTGTETGIKLHYENEKRLLLLNHSVGQSRGKHLELVDELLDEERRLVGLMPK